MPIPRRGDFVTRLEYERAMIRWRGLEARAREERAPVRPTTAGYFQDYLNRIREEQARRERFAVAAPAQPQFDWEDLTGGIGGMAIATATGTIAATTQTTPRPQETPAPTAVPVVEVTAVATEDKDDMPERLANSFNVGCDPEFVVMSTKDKVLNCAHAVPKTGEVGYDHNGLVLEIRPAPAKGTYPLVKRIRTAFLTNPNLKTLKKYKWRAGAAVKHFQADEIHRIGHGDTRLLTLGGHVHLDIPPYGVAGVEEELHNQRLNALDRVTKYMEYLDFLPHKESETRREEGAKMAAGTRYGQWGDWRPAGRANERMEYRTPASWLYDPKIAFLCMTGCKLAAVAPQLAIDTLKVRNINYDNFKAFFELFRHKDTNAARALEHILDVKSVKQLEATPDADLREVWGGELDF